MPRSKPARTRASCAVPPATELRSPCPIAAALDLLGDRWTLLVIRDLVFYGKRRFAEFLASPEGISTNILAERLERLELGGLVERRRYQEHPPRDEYLPTARATELVPALRELIRWGQRNVAGTAQRPPKDLDLARFEVTAKSRQRR